MNELVIIGNGFDLAHGLKTSYKDFFEWYVLDVYSKFEKYPWYYTDALITIEPKHHGILPKNNFLPRTFLEMSELREGNELVLSVSYSPYFFSKLVSQLHKRRWVDIELFYFSHLKSIVLSNNFNPFEKYKKVSNFHKEFSFLISKFSEYISIVDQGINDKGFDSQYSRFLLRDKILFSERTNSRLFLNFNYTDTLWKKYHFQKEEVIHINGQIGDIENNPIVFGYGDESDPAYQQIEDSGENAYLEYIKSFAYFKTPNYHRLLSFIESQPFNCYIVGHSCGLSDRVLLREIFEHENCQSIDIFYHQRKDGTVNFKEMTQEISRHFRPENKSMMRKKILNFNPGNIIPQLRGK